MIASDKSFLKAYLENKNNLPPKNEGGFLWAGKTERLFSALGGAIISYATAKTFDKKDWLHFSMMFIGGILVMRGTKLFSKSNFKTTKRTKQKFKDKYFPPV